MNCLKCGKEIPEGEVFCEECRPLGEQAFEDGENAPADAAIETFADELPVTQGAPEEKLFPEEPDTLPEIGEPTVAFEPVPLQGTEAEEEPEEPEQQQRPKKKKKKKNHLVIPFILVLLMLCGALYYIVHTYNDITRTKNEYKYKEEKYTAMESSIAEKNAEIDALKLEAGGKDKEIAEKEREIEELNIKVNTQESKASQKVYDYDTLLNRISILESEKADLQNQYDGLLQTNQEVRDESRKYRDQAKSARDDREKAQKERDKAKEDLEKLQKEYDDYKKEKKKDDEKVKFMDTYVVFVNNDGSEFYHKYDCPKFKKSNFWAYSIKLAENNGYKPCPDCCK